jgi:hypothetical protein
MAHGMDGTDATPTYPHVHHAVLFVHAESIGVALEMIVNPIGRVLCVVLAWCRHVQEFTVRGQECLCLVYMHILSCALVAGAYAAHLYKKRHDEKA